MYGTLDDERILYVLTRSLLRWGHRVPVCLVCVYASPRVLRLVDAATDVASEGDRVVGS